MSAVPSAPIPLAAGDVLPPRTVGPMTRNHFVRYAGAGGDFNPIHHDETLAQASGYPGVFGMGLLHAGILGVQLARWVGPDNIRSFAVRYTAQVWPGDELTFTGTVTDVVDGLASITLEVVRQTGEVAARATATAVALAP
ncbi:hypothetical protein DSM112329_04666 [Paraconexibacter sp. AEG42_29]|uniref:MaoC-like domain-containing protein n=1 Tax=Paraconexibacter sp. AEG42_29 TaxID=2997339 RepID=A0AAU7B1M8_9ACTN